MHVNDFNVVEVLAIKKYELYSMSGVAGVILLSL